MPAGDKTGPSGQGPFTGRKGGNPPPRLGRSNFGQNFGRGFGFGRGCFRPCPFCFGWNQKPTKKDLEDCKKNLKDSHQEELDQLDQMIKDFK